MSTGGQGNLPPPDTSDFTENVTLDPADVLITPRTDESSAVGVWNPHPSRVDDSNEQEWVSEIKREPRRSCLVTTPSGRKDASPRVQIESFSGEERLNRISSPHPGVQECCQGTWNRAFSYVRSGSRRSRRSTTPRGSIMASIPTFDIREPMTPDIAKEMSRIYQLEEPVDDNVWSYLSWISMTAEITLCLIALWTMWFAPFLAAFAHIYAFCKALIYLDVVLDVFYLAAVGMEFNISVVDRERRTEIQHRGSIAEIRLHSATFYIDILTSVISPLLLVDTLGGFDYYFINVAAVDGSPASHFSVFSSSFTTT